MSEHATGLRCFLAVLSLTLVICQDDNTDLKPLYEEVFGSLLNKNNSNNNIGGGNENGGGGGGTSLITNNEDIRTNEALTGGGSGGSLAGDQCQCVPFYLCVNNTIITDGTGLLDIRIKAQECEDYMDVCCREPLPPEQAITPKPHGRLGCGKRNREGVGFRITGNIDNEAQFGEFPWMIAVLKEDLLDDGSKLNIYQCGGSLIHEQVVLTAAHCVIGKESDSLKIRAGEWDTQTKNELYQHQDRAVAQIITHEKYYSGALYNDIALLILKEPLQFADNVDIVCLPLQGDVVINQECYASGWGKDVFDEEIVKTEAGLPPPGNDGDLNVRFLTHRNDIPNRRVTQRRQTMASRFLQSLEHRRQQRQQRFVPEFLKDIQEPQQQQQQQTQQQQPNFLGGLFQGFQQQQPQQQQQQQPNFLGFFQGLQQQGQQQQQQQRHFLQGLQQQQRGQQRNFAQGLIQNFHQQRNQRREQQQNFAHNFLHGLHNNQNQQQEKPKNFAEGIIQGIQGVIEKKTEFIKSKTEEFVNHFNRSSVTTRKYFEPIELEHSTTFATPSTSIPSTPTVPGKEGHYQVILKKIDLPMVPRDKCVAELRKTRLGPYFRLHDSFVCAGGEPGKDTCKGDGGSPLVCPIPGRDYQYQQVGIVAWGIGCGNVTPAVYANVALFRDWIDNNMKKLNLKFEYNY